MKNIYINTLKVSIFNFLCEVKFLIYFIMYNIVMKDIFKGLTIFDININVKYHCYFHQINLSNNF